VKFEFLTIVSVSVGLAGITFGQGMPSGLLDSPSPLRSAPAIIRGRARFQVLEAGVVRMEYAAVGAFADAPSVAVLNRDRWPQTPTRSREENGWLVINTDILELRYQLDSGPFSSNNLFLQWKDSLGLHSWRPGDADEQNLGGVPGELGGRSTKRVTDPGPLSRKGCYLLDDSKTALFDQAADWVKPRARGGLDWYFLAYGTNYALALRQLSSLLGPVPMLPRYVFGSWFGSRASYSGQEWEMIVQQFGEEQLPVDVIVLDSDSKTKVVWAGYDWDLEQMPDPSGFFSRMAQQGIKVTINEHYGALTRENDSHFETIRQAMGLPADTKEIPHDLADKKYAGLFMDLLHKPDLERGLAFWWQDGAAPANMEGLDPFLWTRHIEYEGSERITGRRTTAFCRQGSCWGSHRYGVFFTGDLDGVWESLPVLIPATVQGGNQLTPYMNNLCCGVFGVDLPPELYERWVQFGAFSPILWFHGLWGLRLPWEYGIPGRENYRKFIGLRYRLLPYIYTCSRVAHETGLPLVRGMYLEYPEQEAAYTNQQQYMFGKELLVSPITAPSDGKPREFRESDRLLVSPGDVPGNGQPARKQVFLPGGQDWFDFFTGDLYTGGQEVVHECPLDRMPLFVRAGSIVPMGPDMIRSDEKPVDPLTLEVYAGRQAAGFNLYEDDGVSLDYRAGAYAWTALRFAPEEGDGNYTLIISPVKGKFKGQLAKRRYWVRVHGLFKPQSVALNRSKLTEAESCDAPNGWWWNERDHTISVRLEKPISSGKETVLQFFNAGTFADMVIWQKAWNLRAQVRQAKRDMKLRHAALVNEFGIKKPPRVIRETEEVERLLTGIIEHPKGRAAYPPDYAALEQRVLAALTNEPFESKRALPELDPDSLKGMELTKGAKFTPEELQTITNRFRGADLPPWLWLGK
jgi:alpha-glucosidase (family GH31 glycosyl hydrolase)